MILPEFQYLVPQSLEEACVMLGRYGPQAQLLAGGTDLLVKMKSGLLKPSYLISLKCVDELKGIRQQPGVGVVIGARTTHNELVSSPILASRFRSVCAAAATMAGYQIRNAGTLGGNLVNAVPSADLPPILIALQAKVRLAGHGPTPGNATTAFPGGPVERTLELEEFFVGPGKTVLQPGEILAAVIIPEQATSGSNYQKFGLRQAEALAVVGVASAVTMEGDIMQEVRIALGAVAPTPMRARQAEALLRGQKVSEKLIAMAGGFAAVVARPISDIRGSAEYRRHLVEVLTRDSLRAAIEKGHS
jgi:carbon-monoxide dehydrogenase medium subunit